MPDDWARARAGAAAAASSGASASRPRVATRPAAGQAGLLIRGSSSGTRGRWRGAAGPIARAVAGLGGHLAPFPPLAPLPELRAGDDQDDEHEDDGRGAASRARRRLGWR